MLLQEKLHPMHMGTSSDLLVGQRVYAIGELLALGVLACRHCVHISPSNSGNQRCTVWAGAVLRREPLRPGSHAHQRHHLGHRCACCTH